MKELLAILPFLFLCFQRLTQLEFTYTQDDSVYAMKCYIFMLISSGKTRSQDSTETMRIQELHLAHLDSLAATGKSIVAGPFQDGSKHCGLLIFDVESIEETIELKNNDPAVRTRRLEMQAF